MLIQPYNKQWILDFQSIKDLLVQALKGLPISIEHVGSTSIPNLASKPIIDIDIIIDDMQVFESVKSGLMKLEYYHNGDQGIPNREVFKRDKALEKHDILDRINHHLYVCVKDSAGLERHLKLRDYLRVDPVARKQYEELKKAIAIEAHQDRKRYAIIKEAKANDFIDEILKKYDELYL